jgi:sugar lactone lactonase YvrE
MVFAMDAVHAETYADARQRMIAAYQAEDFNTMRDAARDVLQLNPGHPGSRYNLALAEALAGDAATSLFILHGLADQGIVYPVADVDAFAGLKERSTWIDYAFKIERLQRPSGSATRAFELHRRDFIPEGIHVVDNDTVYLGSIRHGELVRHAGGDSDAVSSPAQGGHWSVFGMRADSDGKLWFASAAINNLAGLEPGQLGRSGLFRFDPDTDRIIDEVLLPKDDREHVLGDLAIAPNGIIYTTDSLTGAVYQYDPVLRTLETIAEPGRLRSPQGIVVLDDEQHLLVADYVDGLVRIEIESGAIDRVALPRMVSTHGIDGLYREGNQLIAVQNGIQPHKILRMSYDTNSNTIDRLDVLLMNHPDMDEPTLGQIVNGSFYLVANSQWHRFTRDGDLPEENLRAPIILRIPLQETRTTY